MDIATLIGLVGGLGTCIVMIMMGDLLEVNVQVQDVDCEGENTGAAMVRSSSRTVSVSSRLSNACSIPTSFRPLLMMSSNL